MAPSFVQGEPYWVDVSTLDVTAGAGFYTRLFGWQVQTRGDPHDEYTVFTVDGQWVAAMRPCPHGQHPAWLTYFKVPDAVEAAQVVEEAGGAVEVAPTVLPDQSVRAVFLDTLGARFGVWQSAGHEIAQRWYEVGAPCSFTLLVREPSVINFYRELFGWQTESVADDSPDLALTAPGSGRPFGQLHVMGDFIPRDVPNSWVHDFMVTDVDATAARAQELGATVQVAPMELANTARIAFLLDPDGAGFGIAART